MYALRIAMPSKRVACLCKRRASHRCPAHERCSYGKTHSGWKHAYPPPFSSTSIHHFTVSFIGSLRQVAAESLACLTVAIFSLGDLFLISTYPTGSHTLANDMSDPSMRSPVAARVILTLGTLIFLHAAYSTYECISLQKALGLAGGTVPWDVS